MKPIVYLILLVVVSFSCSQSSETEFVREYELVKVGEKKIFIDSVTRPRSNSIQMIEWKGQRSFSLLNGPTNSINIYQYDSGQLTDKILFDIEGANGVGMARAYHFISTDSILLWDKTKLYLANSDAKVLVSYDLSPQAKAGSAPSRVSTLSPIIMKNKDILIGTSLLGHMKHKPFIQLDQQTKDIDYRYKLSDKYTEGFWGGIHFDFYYHTYNAKEDLLTLSYAPDENLYVTDLEGLDKTAYAGSEHMNEITPLYESEAVANPDPDASYVKAVQLGSYGSIHYDAFSNKYYRLALLPVSKEDANKSIRDPWSVMPQHSFIILNEKFEKVGETKMPRFAHKLNMLFSTKEGFHIASDLSENEDELIFDIYEVKKLNSNQKDMAVHETK